MYSAIKSTIPFSNQYSQFSKSNPDPAISLSSSGWRPSSSQTEVFRIAEDEEKERYDSVKADIIIKSKSAIE